MRVLVTIFERMVPISGGGTPRISNVIKAFVARGHEVYVASSIAVSREEAVDRYRCAHWLSIQGVNRLGRWKMPKYMVAFPFNILLVTNYARRLKPDLIVSHNSIAGYSAILAKRFHPQTLALLDLTDLLFEYLEDYRSPWLRAILGLGRRMERTAIRDSEKIITISQAMKGIACGFGARPQDIDVVADGVDTDIFKRVNGDDLRQEHAAGADHVLIFHGVIDPQDHPELLVEAARLVVERWPKTAFWMVGDGAAVPYLKERVARYGLIDRFHFSGWVAQEEVARYISASDLGLVILPDVLSARGRVTLKEFECWACGVPVILPRLPALEEITRDGEGALFYNPEDATSLAEKICALLANEEWRKRLGLAGKRMVEEGYRWPVLAERFVELCEGYLKGRGDGQGFTYHPQGI